MADINDKTFRNTLIERFLDCDTTADEERQLAIFYEECTHNGCVPEGEEDVCALITATVSTAPRCSRDSRTDAPYATAAACRPKRTLQKWMAAACSAAIIAAGAAVALGSHDSEAPTLADNTAVNAADSFSRSTATVTTAITTDAAAQPQKAATGELSASLPTPAAKKDATPAARSTPQPHITADIMHIYNTAAETFGDNASITIERKGNTVLLLAADTGGACQRYVVNCSEGGQLSFIEL